MSSSAVRHVVLFTWTEGVEPERVAAFRDELAKLPSLIPQIVEYQFGPDLGVNPGNADFAIMARFASTDDYVTYRDHPAHRRVVTEFAAPITASRAAAQFEV